MIASVADDQLIYKFQENLESTLDKENLELYNEDVQQNLERNLRHGER